MPGIMIAGTHSGSGKTTVTLALLAALAGRGKTLQSFKAGPDFIDAGLHRLITGRPARNLDLWMCGEEYVRESYRRREAGVDLAVVEGVMGMYDGQYSSASLALLLDLPVLLVIDAYGMAESAGALAQGFAFFAKKDGKSAGAPPRIAGLIFNRVAGLAHFDRLKEAVGEIPVYGWLPRDDDFAIPHRHLGLTVAQENPLSKESLARLARTAEKHFDLDGICKLAQRAPAPEARADGFPRAAPEEPPLRIAYPLDEAFCFYYEDNLDLLREAGAELVAFSPLGEKTLPPDTGALYLGGGYPEIYARPLSANRRLLEDIRRRAQAGMAIYAECGGLIYLSEGIYDLAGSFHPLASLLPFATRMQKRLVQLGYREITLRRDCLLGAQGTRLRGHEFHYSEIAGPVARDDIALVYAVAGSKGEKKNAEGYAAGNVLASYIHLHFGSHPRAAADFVRFAGERKWKTSSSSVTAAPKKTPTTWK